MLPDPSQGGRLPALKRVPRPGDAVEVGRLTGAWGVHGWLKVQPYSASAEALFHANCWLLSEKQTQPVRVDSNQLIEVAVAELRNHGNTLVVAFDGVADRNAAEALAKSTILIPRSAFPSLESAEYYWVDLIGLDVVNRSGERLGQVTDLMPTGSHQVLVVVDHRSSQPRECLIPFVDVYVDDVDLAVRRITVDWSLDY